jgi:electron transfer flavoprotein alpha/beta subunit
MSTIVRAELGKTISPLATRAIESALAIKESEPKEVSQ